MRRHMGHPEAHLLELTLVECGNLGTMGDVFLQTKELSQTDGSLTITQALLVVPRT